MRLRWCFRPSSVRFSNRNGRRRSHRGYDVFLSFRGCDVRRGFVDHLYDALTTAGFTVFLDTYDLERGEDISSGLNHAIQNSRILIPIFSTNYAESAWCLREISLIARQIQEKGKKGPATAVPLFYNVTPSQVRHPDQSHSGPFAQSFQQHESSGRYSSQEISEWKDALFQLCLLSGWSLQEDTNGYEAALVKRVVEDVAKHCRRRTSCLQFRTSARPPPWLCS